MKWWNATKRTIRLNDFAEIWDIHAMAIQDPTGHPATGTRYVRPQEFDDDGLTTHLGATQARVREIMAEFNITSAALGEMASQAEVAITDTALRAEYLRLLIDLHEFGGEAKSRGLLAEPNDDRESDDPGTVERRPGSTEDADAGGMISNRASTNFFNSLDDVD